MHHHSEITILGGGVIGLLTAKEFIDAGCTVTIIDKSLSGRESSWAGGGILLPLYPWRQPQAISTLVIESIKNYQDLSNELIDTTKIDPEWYDCGLLICKNPDIELAKIWCNKYQIPFNDAGGDFFKELETQTIQPLWLPSVAQARNPRLLKALKAYLLNAGVTFFENCKITNHSLKNGKINTLTSSENSFNINELIICTGAWSAELLNNLFPKIQAVEISPIKGQMLLFDANPDTLPHMVLDGDHYLIPRRDGKILVGSSVEQCGFDKSTDTETKDKLYSFATQLFPTLKEFSLCGHWAGLRPGTRQGVPYITQHPEINNLSINAGHFRNGLVMGPASAQLMADLILKRQPSVNPGPYKL